MVRSEKIWFVANPQQYGSGGRYYTRACDVNRSKAVKECILLGTVCGREKHEFRRVDWVYELWGTVCVLLG